MQVTDVHVHLGGKTIGEVKPPDVEAFIEGTGVTSIHLFSRNPIGEGEKVRSYIEELAALQEKLSDRVFAFAWVDPLYEKAPEVARWALGDCGMLGLKMIPAGWYPEDARARAVYEVANSLGKPIQFHSGILWLRGDTSRYCRPAGFEALWDYPRVKFSLAHIAWPWTDECIAVVQKFNRLRPEADQAFVDLTPGTPPIYRQQALERCVAVVGVKHMLFGSDSGLPSGSVPTGKWKADSETFRKLGVSEENQQAIFAGNAKSFRAGHKSS